MKMFYEDPAFTLVRFTSENVMAVSTEQQHDVNVGIDSLWNA